MFLLRHSCSSTNPSLSLHHSHVHAHRHGGRRRSEWAVAMGVRRQEPWSSPPLPPPPFPLRPSPPLAPFVSPPQRVSESVGQLWQGAPCAQGAARLRVAEVRKSAALCLRKGGVGGCRRRREGGWACRDAIDTLVVGGVTIPRRRINDPLSV